MGEFFYVLYNIKFRDTDRGTFEEFERKTYDEFIFAMQMSRGKLKGIKVLYS